MHYREIAFQSCWAHVRCQIPIHSDPRIAWASAPGRPGLALRTGGISTAMLHVSEWENMWYCWCFFLTCRSAYLHVRNSSKSLLPSSEQSFHGVHLHTGLQTLRVLASRARSASQDPMTRYTTGKILCCHRGLSRYPDHLLSLLHGLTRQRTPVLPHGQVSSVVCPMLHELIGCVLKQLVIFPHG